MHETLDELNEEFDTESIEELYDAVAEFFVDEFHIERNDADSFILCYGVTDAYHGVVHEGVYMGSHDSIDDFWESYLEDVYESEYTELLNLCSRMDLHPPEVDTIAVEQSFDWYGGGSVFRNNW